MPASIARLMIRFRSCGIGSPSSANHSNCIPRLIPSSVASSNWTIYAIDWTA